MPINITKLLNTLDDPGLKAWLIANTPSELNELNQTKDDPKTAQVKAVNLCTKIYQSSLRESFHNYVTTHFPGIITEDELPLTAALMVGPSPDPNGVFSNYHPGLLRWPMQIMFKSDDKRKLQSVVAQFASKQFKSEMITIGDYAYIEYIPKSTGLIVPDTNWEILRFKNK